MTERTVGSDTRKRNEGEGSRSAARAFNRRAKDFARSGKVEKAAKSAKKAVEGEERKDLASAEAKGRARAREFDPNVRRDHGGEKP